MSTADEYVRRVRGHLYGVASSRRREVIDDLRAHFADAAELGQPIDEVIADLGDPDEFAARAKAELAGDPEQADAAWRALVWAAVTAAVVTAAVVLFLAPGDVFGGRADGAAIISYRVSLRTPLLAAIPVLLSAAPALFPRRVRTIATAGAAVALTFACVIGGIEVGFFFVPSCLLLWAALVVWVRVRGDGFGPIWHLGTAILAVAPAVVLLAAPAIAMTGVLRRSATSSEGFSPFSADLWLWVVAGLIALSAVLIAFGIRFAGWMLAAIGAAVIVSALVAGGMLTIGLVGTGGLWLALGLGHALATPPRD